jgi:hypothetical protein
VRYRFSSRQGAQSFGQDVETRSNQATLLNAAWLDLRKELWRAWFQKRNPFGRGNSNPLDDKNYRLVKGSTEKE